MTKSENKYKHLTRKQKYFADSVNKGHDERNNNEETEDSYEENDRLMDGRCGAYLVRPCAVVVAASGYSLKSGYRSDGAQLGGGGRGCYVRNPLLWKAQLPDGRRPSFHRGRCRRGRRSGYRRCHLHGKCRR